MTVPNGTGKPAPNQIMATPATPAACANDRAGHLERTDNGRSNAAGPQSGNVYTSAQNGIPSTTGGR